MLLSGRSTKFVKSFMLLSLRQNYVKKPGKFSSLGFATGENLTPDLIKKIIHSDILERRKRSKEKITMENKEREMLQITTTGTVPTGSSLFLSCLHDTSRKEEYVEDDEPRNVHFPLQVEKRFVTNWHQPEKDIVDNVITDNTASDTELSSCKTIEFEHPKKWDEEKNEEILSNNEQFGSCDPSIPVSKVPCGGCGALLHCSSMVVPGFMPKEVFLQLSEVELRGTVCQRCVFLQEYNVALGVTVNPDEYPIILSQIRNTQALVILLIDLLDFPCSIWPNILDVIGRKPVIVVGNKIDLLGRSDEHFIKHVKKCLLNSLEESGFEKASLLHLAVISAKTGFGVERLISTLQRIWGTRGDVYIVGCTNAGKSTLFNTLIQSDFCKVKAAELIQKATVSQWPGTTLNLLKFPILKMQEWRRVLRDQRIRVAKKHQKALENIKQNSVRITQKDQLPSLIGYIGQTFKSEGNLPNQPLGLDPDDPDFKHGKWCYDTPGVVHEAQILDLLTGSELLKVLPKTEILPRNFRMTPGYTLFIGGIARLDYVYGSSSAWFTVFASADIPVTIVKVEDGDVMYENLLKSDLLIVPEGNRKRLEKWPKLESMDLIAYGKQNNVACADVVLSSAGWVAITTSPATSCSLRAWTPGRRGIFLRLPAIIENNIFIRNRNF